jgi:hypothetical protein
MTAQGQTEKNSVRAYVFRFSLKLGHCSTQSACLTGSTTEAAAKVIAAKTVTFAPVSCACLRVSRKKAAGKDGTC